MKIAIIGAGIGGLTTAIALKQKGFEVEIFEAVAEFKKVGAGINLAINAMQVYKELGMYDEILAAGNHTNAMKISTKNLEQLSMIDLKPFEEKHLVKSVAIHRATLHQLLLNKLSDVKIHLNKKVEDIKQSNNKVEIFFKDNTHYTTNVLIGSDGINSSIRRVIFKSTALRKAKQICWRGVTAINLEEHDSNQLIEAWGKGRRFGFVAINKTEYYWFALAKYTTNYKEEFKGVELTELFSDFNPLVNRLISSTPQQNILVNEIVDLKPIPNWFKNNICLLGDSAHATTPNLGQGACQAIESALVLAKCLEKYEKVDYAFKEFQQIRMKKAKTIINTSWKVGKMAHLENPILVSIRNFMLKYTPQKIANKQSEYIYEIDEIN